MYARSSLACAFACLLIASALPAAGAPVIQRDSFLEWPALDVAIDGAGNAYVVGYTSNEDETDAYARKVAPNGTIMWTRTLGGSSFETARAVSVDSSGNVYLGGHTSSTDFAVTSGAWDTTFGGDYDAWAAKLRSDGSVVYATYVGGNDGDAITDLDWGPSGSVAIGGVTHSCDFPTTGGAYDTTFNHACFPFDSDAFVLKLASDGRSAIFSSFFGGTDHDYIAGVAVSRSSGSVMIAGNSWSADLPTSSGAFQRDLKGGVDGFVAKLSSSGSSLSFSTFLGGSGWDMVTDVARDAAGDAFVVGSTESTDLPTTPGAFQTRFGGGTMCSYYTYPEEEFVESTCRDAFAARLNDGGGSLDYLTYIGTEFEEYAEDVAIDSAGNAYVIGGTNSSVFPEVDAMMRNADGESHMYTLALSPNGKALVYSQLTSLHRFPEGLEVTSGGVAYASGVVFREFTDGFLMRLGAPTSGVVISPRGGNEFWVETYVGGTKAGEVTKVEARDANTPWTTLSKSPWGFYAGEVHVEPGNLVHIRATTSSGAVTTACFTWPEASPRDCPSTGQPVTFTHGGGNEWWVEVKIDPKPVSAQAMDTGGSWVDLEFKSWGEWAKSFHIEPGHQVKFRATYANGTSVESCWFSHPAGVSDCGGGGGGGGEFDATFRSVRGNEWWIETDVSVTGGTLAGVDARVNGGSWVALEKKSWGSWAKSIHAPAGSSVEFRARATDGSTDLSAAYSWPPS